MSDSLDETEEPPEALPTAPQDEGSPGPQNRPWSPFIDNMARGGSSAPVTPAAPAPVGRAPQAQSPDHPEQDPWAQQEALERSHGNADPWAAQEALEKGQTKTLNGQTLDQALAGDASRFSFSRIGNAFIDGWNGVAIVPPDKWSLGPESEKQLKTLLTYPEIDKAQQTEWQAFNNAYLYPAVRALARGAAIGENQIVKTAQLPLQLGGALFGGAVATVGEAVGSQLGPQAGREAAALAEFLPMHTTGIPHVPEAPGAVGPLSARRMVPGEVAGEAPAFTRRPVTPDLIEQARQEGVIGTQAEWDGSVVYNAAAPEPGPLDIHGVARQIDPETFERYDRLRAVHDLALQEFRDETERARTEVEASPNAHGDELADIGAELDNLQNVPNDRYVYRRRNQLIRQQEQLRQERDDYLANAPDLTEMVLRSPENLQLRNFIADNAAQLGQIEGRVRDVYAEAARRMPEDAVAVAPSEVAAPAVEPPSEAAPPQAPAQPALDIATHAADQFRVAGRPEQESSDLGALADAYYRAKSDLFQGAKGSAEDLYRAEFPTVVGRAQGPRGASGMLQRGGGRSILTLFAKSDPSTAIHELGHGWTLDMLRDAADPAAPASLVRDADAVRSWLNVPESGDLNVRQQERMARAFETYMREGTAPTARLAGVFERFKDWITTVYQTLRNRQVTINDDIRGVFDRWFAEAGEQRPSLVAAEPEGPPRVRTPAEISAANPRWSPERVSNEVIRDVEARARWQQENPEAWAALREGRKPPVARPEPVAEAPPETPPETETQAAEPAPPAEVAPERAAEVAPEPVVAKNFGPEAKPEPPKPDRSRPYMRVPKEPQRLLEFLKEGVINENGVRLYGRLKDPQGELADGLRRVDPKLVKKFVDNQNGEGIDVFARRAADAGYFDGIEPETNGQLVDRLVADIEGHAQYSMHDQEHVNAYQTATAHNREVTRLAAEHDIDPKGMTRQGFFQAVEDKIGKDQFDAQEAMERARAIDAANEMRDDLQDWQGNEDERANGIDESEFERLWGEANASQELVGRESGGEQPGVSGGNARPGEEGAGHGGGGAGDAGSAEGQKPAGPADGGAIPTRGAAEQQRAGGEPGGSAGATPDPTPPAFPVSRPTPAFEAADRARNPDPPKIGNIRLEYIPEGRYDQLVQDVISQMQADGTFGQGATMGRMQARAEQAIFTEALNEWGKARDKFQAEPTAENAIAEEQARGVAAVSASSRSQETGFAGGYLAERGRIIKESQRRVDEMRAQGLTDSVTLLQRQLENALHGILNDSEQVGRALVRDYGFKDRVKNGLLPYWMTNVLSNPETHGGYGIGGFITNLWEGIGALPIEAATGAVREALGGEAAGRRAYFGEAPAYLFGLWNGYARALVPAVRVGNLLDDILTRGPTARAVRTGEVAYPGLQSTADQIRLADQSAKRAAATGQTPRYAMSDGELIMPYQQKIMTQLLGGWPGYLLETPLRVIRAIHLVNYTSRFYAEVSRMAYRAAQEGEPDALTMGVRMQNYFNNISEADIGYAHKVAIDSTLGGDLNPKSASTKVVGAIKNFEIGGFPIGRFVAPFPNVGIKMLQQWGQYTPLGYGIKDVRENIAAGGARADTAYGRMAAGSALAMGVAGLAFGGLITGPGPDLSTPEGRAESFRLQQSGWKPFSFRMGSMSLPYVKLLGPIGRLIGVAATMGVASKAGLHGELDQAGKIVEEGFKEMIFDDSWMRSIHDLADAAINRQELSYYAYSMASGLVPWSAFQRETARLVDPYVRRASGMLERLMKETPFLSESLQPKIGWNGEPLPQATTLGPTWRNDDPVQQRIDALGMGQSDFAHSLKGVPLSEEQRTLYSRLAGTFAHQQLLPMVSAPGFAQLPAGVQMKNIQRIVERSRHRAELMIQAQNPDLIQQQLARTRGLRMNGRPSAAGTYLPN